MPNKIIQLPKDLISIIAAGEVIERPACVVKELIENAIDAQASSIRIIIQNSGLKKIIVIDNGMGMSHKDLQIAPLPHTTSKINNKQDLYQIKTLGFRGEALASIAQISHLTIKSRAKDKQIGHEIKINGGMISQINPTGTHFGTNIIVDNLFYNVPVRKKFLKSSASELRQIIQVVTSYALCYPTKKFFLSHNQKIIFDLSSQNLKLRIRSLLGTPIYNHLLPIQLDDPYLNFYGFIGDPETAKKTTDKQYLFINKRKVISNKITNLLKKPFAKMLEGNLKLPYVVFLSLPVESIDVNVHPKKNRIKFMDENTIYQQIRKGVENSLNIIFKKNKKLSQQAPFSLKQATIDLKKQLDCTDQNPNNKQTPIIQINALYLATQHQNSLILIDQHAAHERILYEKYLKAFKNKKNQSQILSKPILLELSIQDTELMLHSLEKMKDYGFKIEHFFKNNFKVTSIPKIFAKRDVQPIIEEILIDMKNHKSESHIDHISDQLIKIFSCRHAIKAGDELNQEDRINLIKQLQKCDNPFLCPHGRPTIIKITPEELAKMFKRK